MLQYKNKVNNHELLMFSDGESRTDSLSGNRCKFQVLRIWLRIQGNISKLGFTHQ